jgi:hypothetical protein
MTHSETYVLSPKWRGYWPTLDAQLVDCITESARCNIKDQLRWPRKKE